jgi:hypothetical protein
MCFWSILVMSSMDQPSKRRKTASRRNWLNSSDWPGAISRAIVAGMKAFVTFGLSATDRLRETDIRVSISWYVRLQKCDCFRVPIRQTRIVCQNIQGHLLRGLPGYLRFRKWAHDQMAVIITGNRCEIPYDVWKKVIENREVEPITL